MIVHDYIRNTRKIIYSLYSIRNIRKIIIISMFEKYII